MTDKQTRVRKVVSSSKHKTTKNTGCWIMTSLGNVHSLFFCSASLPWTMIWCLSWATSLNRTLNQTPPSSRRRLSDHQCLLVFRLSLTGRPSALLSFWVCCALVLNIQPTSLRQSWLADVSYWNVLSVYSERLFWLFQTIA